MRSAIYIYVPMKYAFCNLWSKIHEVLGKGALFLSKDSYNDKNYNTNNINRIRTIYFQGP